MHKLRTSETYGQTQYIDEYLKSASGKEQLEAELADARLLHQLSIQLIQEDGTAGLYKKIVEAAVAIMRSNYASMQMLYPDPVTGGPGKLRLLASSNFTPEAEKFWEWVYRHTGSSCGAALRAERRVIIEDFRTDEYMQTAPTLSVFLEAGIYSAQSTPLYSRSGKLLGMISTHWNFPHNPPQRHLDLLDILARQAADLIERTQTEEALKESEARLRVLTSQLETMVTERTKELQHSNNDLQQFAHVASHDLKEPVRKIRTFGLRLRSELEASTENAKKYTEKILQAAQRMTTMIEGVMCYSSLNAAEMEFEVLDLDTILSDIRNDLEVLITEKNASINYGQLPKIRGVRVMIYQLFYNLINNSLKFSRPSVAPVVTIDADTLCSEGIPYTRIVVADNGIGFDPVYSEIIFKTFTRLHPKSRYDGAGLGLSLCKNIVERHGGSILAGGAKDTGASFTIMLPVK